MSNQKSKQERDAEIERLRARFGQVQVGSGGGAGAGPSRQYSDSSSSSDSSDEGLDDYIQSMRDDNTFEEGEVGSNVDVLFGRGIERVRTQNDRQSRLAQKQKEDVFKGLFKKGFRLSKERIVQKKGQQSPQSSRPSLYPQRRRNLRQILNDMRQRRQEWRSTAGKRYYGSPAVRRSRQLVDRSKHILSHRRPQIDPQMSRRIDYKKKLKKEWQPFRDRQTAYGSTYKIRDLEYSRAKDYLERRRQTALSGESFADPIDPGLQSTVPMLSMDFDEVPEEDESGAQSMRYHHQNRRYDPMGRYDTSSSSDYDEED